MNSYNNSNNSSNNNSNNNNGKNGNNKSNNSKNIFNNTSTTPTSYQSKNPVINYPPPNLDDIRLDISIFDNLFKKKKNNQSKHTEIVIPN